MNKYTDEKWFYYDGGRAYIVCKLKDAGRYGDYRAETDKEEIARLIAAAPKMYELLKAMCSGIVGSATPSFWLVREQASKLLDRIDGEQEDNS